MRKCKCGCGLDLKTRYGGGRRAEYASATCRKRGERLRKKDVPRGTVEVSA